MNKLLLAAVLLTVTVTSLAGFETGITTNDLDNVIALTKGKLPEDCRVIKETENDIVRYNLIKKNRISSIEFSKSQSDFLSMINSQTGEYTLSSINNKLVIKFKENGDAGLIKINGISCK